VTELILPEIIFLNPLRSGQCSLNPKKYGKDKAPRNGNYSVFLTELL